MSRVESIDPWVQRQPACCVQVVCQPRTVGSVTLQTVKEAVCEQGCHRIREMVGQRTVYDRRTGSANPVWQGIKP